MAAMLAAMAFVLVLVGDAVQATHRNSEVKFAVAFLTGIPSFFFLVFAAKVYFQ